MGAETWRDLGLLLHIIGIILLAGGTIGGPIADRFIWRNLETAPLQAAGITPLVPIFSMCAQVGSIVMLLSGLTMMQAESWVYWGQIWLDIKLGLFVLLTVNGIVNAKPAGEQLAKLMPQWLQVTSEAPSPIFAGGDGRTAVMTAPTVSKTDLEREFVAVRRRFAFFHTSETVMFFAVLVLAVFKFN